MSKPLMSPKPRRQDRRSGWRSERLREALLEPTGLRRGERPPDEKRRALDRLLRRYVGRSRSVLLSLVLLGSVVFFVRGTWRAMAVADALVPFEDARADYDRLAAAASAACEADVCAWGWHSPGRPPSPVASAMARVRARSVRFDQAGQQTLVWPGYPRGAHLHHVAGSDKDRVLFGTRIAFRDSLRRLRNDPRPGPDVTPLGDGWYRVPN